MKDHELFPEKEDKPAPNVEHIWVGRVENGAVKWSPLGYVPVEELPNAAALYARYGGGRYELKARDAKKITGLATIVLDGPSKPLDGSTPERFPVPQLPPTAPSGGGTNWMALAAALSPLILGYLQMQSEAARAQSQLMVALMTAKGADSQAHTQAMAQMYAAQTQQMASLFQAIGAKSGGDGGETALIKGVELAMGLAEGMRDRGAAPAGDTDDIVKMGADVISLLERGKALAKEEGSGGPPPAPRAQSFAPPPPPHEEETEDPGEASEG
jgi:hypothetical protein